MSEQTYLHSELTLISFLERLVFFTRNAISSLDSPLSGLLSLVPILEVRVVVGGRQRETKGKMGVVVVAARQREGSFSVLRVGHLW